MQRHYYLILLTLWAFACSQQAETLSGETQMNQVNFTEEEIQGSFDLIKGLEGDWSGRFEWSGDKSGGGDINFRYFAVGSPQTIGEMHMTPSGRVSMTTMYHLDGPSSLKLTHYCFYNQPRMELSFVDLAQNQIGFQETGITNDQRYPGHVYAIDVKRISSDSLHLDFSYREDEKLSVEHVELARDSN